MMRSDVDYRRKFNEEINVPRQRVIGAIIPKLSLICLYYERMP